MSTTVHSLLLQQQRSLLQDLDESRNVHEHPTDLGDATELNWKRPLRTFLPERYQLAKAKVLDANDQISEQIDLVIFDRQFCPLWFGEEGTSQYIPAESVYAAFEIKQELKGHMGYASEKIESVRKLHRTSAPIVHAGGRYDETKRPFPIIGGILARRAGWKSPPLGKAFENALGNESSEHRRLDIGCALMDGGFDVVRDEHGEAWINRSEADVSLIFFLMRLFTRLQALGTVPAIDLGHYARSLES